MCVYVYWVDVEYVFYCSSEKRWKNSTAIQIHYFSPFALNCCGQDREHKVAAEGGSYRC